MNSFTSLLNYSLIYAKNYILESLAIRFPRAIFFLPKPLYIGLSVGTRCNFKCRQCDLWQLDIGPNKLLSLKQIKSILIKLKKLLGSFRLVFTGAEPFVRKDIFKIIKFCSDNEIYTVLTSNGWLIDKNLAEKIVSSRLNVINISLDGANAETHDFLRGKKGAFNRAIRALKLLVGHKKKTPTIYINTVIMDFNVDQLEDIIKVVKEIGVNNIRFQALESKYLFGNKKYNPYWFKREPLWPQNWQRLAKVLDKIKTLKEKRHPIKNTYSELEDLKLYYKNPLSLVKKQKYCYTGVRNFSIDSQGKVRLCFGMEPIGDLLKNSPQDIWYGKKAREQRQIIAHCQRACRILPCNKRENLSQIFNAFKKRFKLL